jgi:ADP-heptose:LPS heptosyltransferase
MKIVEVIKDLKRPPNLSFKAGTKLVMAEDSESQLRSLAPDCFGMSYPLEAKYQKYSGQDLNGKKLFIWRTGGIGDICYASPLFSYLKKKYPTCHLSMATGCKEPLENLPEIDALYSMPFDVSLLNSSDYVMHFQGIIESQSEASKRTHASDMFFSYLGIDSLQFSAEDKRPRLVFTDTEKQWVESEFQKLQVQKDDYVVGIQVETSSPVRNWPKEKMATVVNILAREPKVKVVLIGSAAQAVVGNFIKGNNTNVFVATSYTVRQSICLATRYDLIVAPDSFMVQVAGGLEKPLIGLYGPFPSELRMKYFKNAIALEPKAVCTPCFTHDFRACIKGFPSPCFSLISPEDVLQAIDYQKNKFFGGHFGYMTQILQPRNFADIERYFLSADKGLCFFGAYYKHYNMIRVDDNKFVGADITDFNYPFEWGKYPFVFFINNFGFQNGAVFNNSKNFVRPGGYFIAYRENCVEGMFQELLKGIGQGFTILYSKFDPAARTGLVVGQKI